MPVKQNRLLVYGASASGKTLLCHEVLKQCPRVFYVSASKMLRRLLPIDVGRGGRNQEVQLILCEYIRRICENTPADDVLIDGHLYVPSSGGGVPEAAIASLELTALLQVNEAVATVSQRRHYLGKQRKSIRESREDIENEAEAAQSLSASLGLPIVQINPPLSVGVSTVISHLSARQN